MESSWRVENVVLRYILRARACGARREREEELLLEAPTFTSGSFPGTLEGREDSLISSSLREVCLTFCVRERLSLSTTGGWVLGMAPIRVTPPANAAAVHDEKSSLWV